MPNIRHEIDPALVREQIEKAVAHNEGRRIHYKEEAQKTLESYEKAKLEKTTHLWSKVPEGPGYVDPMIDSWNLKQTEHYAKVRVIELEEAVLTHNGSWNKFILVYGDVDDTTVKTGTGPFATLDDAKGWFLRSGR